GRVAFALQRPADRPRAAWRRLAVRMSVTGVVGSLGALARAFRRLAALRRRQIDTGAAGLPGSQRRLLLGGAWAVFGVPHVVHCFADELAGLHRRALALMFVASGSLQCFSFRHGGYLLAREPVFGVSSCPLFYSNDGASA